MIVKYGEGCTEYGPDVNVELTGDEVAMAIDAWLVAHGAHVSGARTVTVNGGLCVSGRVCVDPSGFVIADSEKFVFIDGEELSNWGPDVVGALLSSTSLPDPREAAAASKSRSIDPGRFDLTEEEVIASRPLAVDPGCVTLTEEEVIAFIERIASTGTESELWAIATEIGNRHRTDDQLDRLLTAWDTQRKKIRAACGVDVDTNTQAPRPAWEPPLRDDVSAALKILESGCNGDALAEQALSRVRRELSAAVASELRRQSIRRVARDFFKDRSPGIALESSEFAVYHQRLREAACQPDEVDPSSVGPEYYPDEALWLCEQAKKIAALPSNLKLEDWPNSDVARCALAWISTNLRNMADQLEASAKENAMLLQVGIESRGSLMQEVAKETDQKLNPSDHPVITKRVSEMGIPQNADVPPAEDEE